MQTNVFTRLELSRAYTVALAVMQRPDAHGYDDVELKRAIRIFRYISRDDRVEGRHGRAHAAGVVKDLQAALAKRAGACKIIRFYDGSRRVATVATIAGIGDGNTSIVFTRRYDLKVSIWGDVPFARLESFIRAVDESAEYVWIECTRIELVYDADVGEFRVVTDAYNV